MKYMHLSLNKVLAADFESWWTRRSHVE